MKSLWSPWVKVWFPHGVDDPVLAESREGLSAHEAREQVAARHRLVERQLGPAQSCSLSR